MSVSRFCPCLGIVLSRICRVQDMSVSRICPCLGYVLSRFGRVQVWSCLGLVCLGFVLSRICLSRFGPGTIKTFNIYFKPLRCISKDRNAIYFVSVVSWWAFLSEYSSYRYSTLDESETRQFLFERIRNQTISV